MHTYRAGRDRGYIFWIGTLDGHPMVDVGSGELNESIELATCLLAAHFHPRFTVLSGTAGAQNAELMWATWSWAGTRWTNRPATMSSVVTRQGKDPIGPRSRRSRPRWRPSRHRVRRSPALRKSARVRCSHPADLPPEGGSGTRRDLFQELS